MISFVKRDDDIYVGDIVFIQTVVSITPTIEIIPTYSNNEYEGNIGTIMSKQEYIDNHASMINGRKLSIKSFENLTPVKLADSNEAIVVSPSFLFKRKSHKLSPLVKIMMKELEIKGVLS